MTKKINKAAKKLAKGLINSNTVDLLIVASLEETIDISIAAALEVIHMKQPQSHRVDDFWDCIRAAKAAIVVAGYYSTNDYYKLDKRIMKLQKSFKEIHGELDK
jgi:hypothetical protein